MKLKQAISNYCSSWWVPATTCLALLAALIIAALPHWRPFFIVLKILFVCLAVALLGFLGSAVWNFIQKRLAIGVADLVLFLLCGAAAVVTIAVYTFLALRRVQQQGRLLTIAKMVLLLVGYVVALIITMFLTLAITALLL